MDVHSDFHKILTETHTNSVGTIEQSVLIACTKSPRQHCSVFLCRSFHIVIFARILIASNCEFLSKSGQFFDFPSIFSIAVLGY